MNIKVNETLKELQNLGVGFGFIRILFLNLLLQIYTHIERHTHAH